MTCLAAWELNQGWKLTPWILILHAFFPLAHCSVVLVLQFLSGVVRRDMTTSLLLECTVEAVPPATLHGWDQEEGWGWGCGPEYHVRELQMLILQYTLRNLMVNDSGAYVCWLSTPLDWVSKTSHWWFKVSGFWIECEQALSIIITTQA